MAREGREREKEKRPWPLIFLSFPFLKRSGNVLYVNDGLPHVSHSSRETYKKWNKMDYLFYEHFNRSLWDQIEAEGQDFWDELAHFRKVKCAKKCSALFT